jgi:hypothetical protein
MAKISKKDTKSTVKSNEETTSKGQEVAPPAYGISLVDGQDIQLKALEEEELVKNKQKKTVQLKLKVGQKGDPFEREADQVADRIMRMENANILSPKTLDDSHRLIHPKADKAPSEASSGMEHQLKKSKGNGQPLPTGTSRFMQQAFGADFSGVRIHSGKNAIQMNQELNAKAFTHGKDVYFNKGQYQPGTPAGKHLLAHELTHVVQQGKGANTNLLKQNSNILSPKNRVEEARNVLGTYTYTKEEIDEIRTLDLKSEEGKSFFESLKIPESLKAKYKPEKISRDKDNDLRFNITPPKEDKKKRKKKKPKVEYIEFLSNGFVKTVFHYRKYYANYYNKQGKLFKAKEALDSRELMEQKLAGKLFEEELSEKIDKMMFPAYMRSLQTVNKKNIEKSKGFKKEFKQEIINNIEKVESFAIPFFNSNKDFSGFSKIDEGAFERTINIKDKEKTKSDSTTTVKEYILFLKNGFVQLKKRTTIQPSDKKKKTTTNVESKIFDTEGNIVEGKIGSMSRGKVREELRKKMALDEVSGYTKQEVLPGVTAKDIMERTKLENWVQSRRTSAKTLKQKETTRRDSLFPQLEIAFTIMNYWIHRDEKEKMEKEKEKKNNHIIELKKLAPETQKKFEDLIKDLEVEKIEYENKIKEIDKIIEPLKESLKTWKLIDKMKKEKFEFDPSLFATGENLTPDKSKEKFKARFENAKTIISESLKYYSSLKKSGGTRLISPEKILGTESVAKLCNVISYYFMLKTSGMYTGEFHQFYIDLVKKGYLAITTDKKGLEFTGIANHIGSWLVRESYGLKLHTVDDLLRSNAKVAITGIDGRPPKHFMLIVKGEDGIWRNMDHTSPSYERRGAPTNWNRVTTIVYFAKSIKEIKKGIEEKRKKLAAKKAKEKKAETEKPKAKTD